jgi:aldose 1-epimerase
MINEKSFDKLVQGKQVGLYTIESTTGLKAQITNYGAKIVTLYVPQSDGNMVDVVLGFKTLDEWLAQEVYFNGINGRVAGRISYAQAEIDGELYHFTQNSGEHTLHGGTHGFNDKVWDVVEVTANSISLQYLSPDGEEGFPGNMNVVVRYVVEDNDLNIYYDANTDKPTIINLTNHAYFNLKGEGQGDIHDHTLQVLADEYIPYDENTLPMGCVIPVDGTPMDMRQPTTIADRIDDVFFASGLGIDNGWALPGWNQLCDNPPLRLAAVLKGGKLAMETWTTFPCMQVYSGNYVEHHLGKSDTEYFPQCAICLEAELFPDAVHHNQFPNSIIRPDQKWQHQTIYRFI